MPAPSLENRSAFKNYIRHFKSKFTSQIQDITLSQFENVLSTKAADVGDVPVKFIVFDNYDTIDVTSLRDNDNYVYLPGLPGDSINFTIDNNNVNLAIVGEASGVKYNDTTYTVNQNIYLNDANNTKIVVKGLGGALIQLTTTNYNITASSTSADENGSVTFTINTNNVADGTDLYWTLGAVSGSVTTGDFTGATDGTVTINSNTGSVTVSLNPDETTEGVEKFLLALRLDSIAGEIVATSSAITINDTSLTPTYAIAPDVTNVNEGGAVTFTVTTTNVSDGTTLYYSTTGTTEAADFTDNTLVGSFVINSNTATITRTLVNDLTLDATEGSENFALEIRTVSIAGAIQSTSSSVTVADTSTASYTTTISSTQSAEETTLTINVATIGIPDGYTLYYSTSGVASTATDLNSVSGSFVVNSNVGTFDIDLLQDYIPDDGETFTVNIRTGSISGSIVSSVGPITVDDTPFILVATTSATIVNESTLNTNQTLTITITTANVPDGTTFDAEVRSTGGTVDSNDMSPFTTSLTISNNTASYDIALGRDARTEGLETFVVDIKKGGVTITSTPVIALADLSYIGSRITNKTFGPIVVNRDNNNAANASDWYTICGLDSVPSGSKIALFIDNSGSMTRNTIRKSFELLLSKCQARNITIVTTENASEDWITPFNKNFI